MDKPKKTLYTDKSLLLIKKNKNKIFIFHHQLNYILSWMGKEENQCGRQNVFESEEL